MGLVYSIVASLCLWIVLWALGAKALDSFLLAALLIIIAVTVQMLQKYNPSKRRRGRRPALCGHPDGGQLTLPSCGVAR